MKKDFLLWLWSWISSAVEGVLNPEQSARTADIKKKIVQLELDEKKSAELDRQSEALSQKNQQRRAELDRLLAESASLQAENVKVLAEIDQRVKGRDNANEKADANIGAGADDNAFSGVPKPRVP